MTSWQRVVVVAAILGGALTLAQAIAPPRRSGQNAPAAARSPAPVPVEGDPATQAEERLLSETTFSHPVEVPAPAVEVVDRGDHPVHLAPPRGQVVLVNFWASWCGPCVEEMPGLLRLAAELRATHPRDFRAIAISGDDGWAPIHRFFQDRFGGVPGQLELLRDPESAAAHAYYCAARGYCPDVKYPETYLIDRQGRIVEMVVGQRDWSSPAARQLIERLIGG